jgi:hypothetical protein
MGVLNIKIKKILVILLLGKIIILQILYPILILFFEKTRLEICKDLLINNVYNFILKNNIKTVD